jgi:hypothetical protein
MARGTADDAHGPPSLPFHPGPVTNGEFVPLPASRRDRWIAELTLARVAELADRLRMDRRALLHHASGMAAMLGVVNLAACGDGDSGASSSTRRPTTVPTSGPGGTFDVPDPTDVEACVNALGGDEFVFDVQTHLLDFDLTRPASGGFGSGFPQAGCDADDWRACFDVEHWLLEVFLRSDTALAVISAVPILSDPNPLSIAVMEKARRAADQLCGDGRIRLHGQVNPNVGALAVALDGMARLADEHPIAAWKVYTHVPGGRGWWLDDHDPASVRCGQAFLERVREVGPPIVCVHKGFGGGAEHSSPADVGAAAAANPDLSFVVYHSGYDGAEGPFGDDTAGVGVNRLVQSLRDHGIGPGGNVYAELGSTWFLAMRDPTQAAHVLGKLLLAVGEDNVVWGTDSIWYGSPQGQIEAFRSFQISEELQERFGYPSLTEVAKRKILGLNSARVYGVDPASVPAPCDTSPEELEELRLALPPPRSYGPRTAAEVRALVAAHGGMI